MSHYWVGPGVFNHKGKDHMPGDEVKGLDKKQADAMVKKGTLCDEAPKVGRPSNELSQLREQVAKLSADCDGYKRMAESKDAALADVTAERDELKEKLAAAEKNIAGLTEQITKPADTTVPAGPKK